MLLVVTTLLLGPLKHIRRNPILRVLTFLPFFLNAASILHPKRGGQVFYIPDMRSAKSVTVNN